MPHHHSAVSDEGGSGLHETSHMELLRRVVELGKRNPALLGPTIVKLEYGHGFERYGMYDGDDSGWDVKVNGVDLASGKRYYNLPKSVLLAELNLGITSKGAPDRQYEKKQSMCMDRQKSSGCRRGVGCKYDHDIMDSKRLESLATTFSGGDPQFETRDFLTVECYISGMDGDAVIWKIVMKPDAFRGVKATDPLKPKIPTNQIVFDGNDLLDVLNRVEDFVGIKTHSETE
ncbi:hypothetical protein Moror_8588 [Moniliophthora roreri MCA 2997]|uniref:C3H1-type domain-containing protein n=1 Tax=Moniliophthora roreri (strain MCA 2997) TaxID=1381753 RepID=V2XB31_MONRO|nr:hypothetical protein Moror_8588 [Moniliophthora roreri MCA 2997]